MKKHPVNPITVFFVISFSGILSFFVYAFFHGGTAYDWLAMENDYRLNFIDFFMHVGAVADRHTVYMRADGPTGSFPALAYMMYYFFYKLICRQYAPDNMYDTMNMPHAMLVFVFYSVVTAVLLLIAVYMTGSRDMKLSVCLFFSLLLSAPFYAGGIEKGNSVVLVVIFLIIALNLKDSDEPWMKEAALILIAVCAGLKIYPAVFGLLYLLEKRFKEAIRLTVYGAAAFFAPFMFFGRIDGFKMWLSIIKNLSQLTEYGRIQFIKGVVYTGLIDLTGREYSVLAGISSYIFLILMIILCCLSANRYRRMFYLCAVMALFANFSYRYTLCYMAVPLVFYVKENYLRETPEEPSGNSPGNKTNDTTGFKPLVTMILYGLLFSIPTWWGAMTGFGLSYGEYTYIMTYVDMYLYAIVYLLVIIMVVFEITEVFRCHSLLRKTPYTT